MASATDDAHDSGVSLAKTTGRGYGVYGRGGAVVDGSRVLEIAFPLVPIDDFYDTCGLRGLGCMFHCAPFVRRPGVLFRTSRVRRCRLAVSRKGGEALMHVYSVGPYS